MFGGIFEKDKGIRNMGKSAVALAFIIFFSGILSCSTVIRRDLSVNRGEITEKELWQIHKDVRYTKFIYGDSVVNEGLLLRWMPDSILVQPRKQSTPVWISAQGVSAIQVEIGNRMPEWIAISVLAAGAYVAALKSWELTSASMGEGVAKLLGPPVIVFSAMGIGSSINKYQEYKIPQGFKFNYDKVDGFYRILE